MLTAHPRSLSALLLVLSLALTTIRPIAASEHEEAELTDLGSEILVVSELSEAPGLTAEPPTAPPEASRPAIAQPDLPAGSIIWKQDQRLSWDDFPLRQTGPARAAAWVATGISGYRWDCGPNGEFWFAGAQAYMVPSRSGVRDGYQVPEVLNHEQRHFDLSELYARRIRAEFRQLSCAGKSQLVVHQEAYAIYGRANLDHDMEQARYDSQSSHGTRTPTTGQALWDALIQSRLDETGGQ